MTDTVAAHGLRWRFNGFPLFAQEDEWGESEIYGYISEPKWNEADLTAEQKAEVDALVSEHLAKRPDDGEMRVRWALLDWHGIEHTHRRGKPLLPYRPAYGYECAMCHAYIVVKEPGDSRFVGGPLDGRWIVTDGRPSFYAPVVGGGTVTYLRDSGGNYRLSQ